MTNMVFKGRIETVEQLENVMRYISSYHFQMDTLKELLANNMTKLDDALFDLEGHLETKARLVDVQNAYHPYDWYEKWVVAHQDGTKTWITAKPKRKSTTTKHGYVEGYVRYKYALWIEVPLVGVEQISFYRQGEPIELIPDAWEYEKEAK